MSIENPQFCQTDVSGSTFLNADCFDVFPFIEDNSIDAIICDLPYGTTACKWDSVLPFDLLWKEYERIIKPNGAIILTASQPFTSALIMSNIKLFKYDIEWIKERPSNPALAQKRPLNYKEQILVFYKNMPTYNPQFTKREEKNKRNNKNEKFTTETSAKLDDSFKKTGMNDFCYPKNYLMINVERGLHPTQKPLKLFENLINTYTNAGDIILDNCMGSGTTNLACIKLNRKSIGIEKEKQYFDVAVRRAKELIRNTQYKNISNKENYDKLLSSGMFWEFHPELSGNWEKDSSRF